MTNATKKPGGWSAVCPQLTSWDKPTLLALVKDLYDAAAVNRDFIQARCQSGENGGEILEKYRVLVQHGPRTRLRTDRTVEQRAVGIEINRLGEVDAAAVVGDDRA